MPLCVKAGRYLGDAEVPKIMSAWRESSGSTLSSYKILRPGISGESSKKARRPREDIS